MKKTGTELLESINPYYADVPEVQQAAALLPADYRPIDADWVERNQEAVALLKKAFDSKGGIHLLSVDDYAVIARAPSREILNRGAKEAGQVDRIEADFKFVSQCMLYPSPALLAGWMNEHAGVASAFASKLLELSKANQEAQAKKL
ncbi:MAG: hypothetical protein HS115_11765 [Spirochaetales bacterium]|nr:hypothetical protein [Spirochaetales bacterium]